jgi:hypothetical protein
VSWFEPDLVEHDGDKSLSVCKNCGEPGSWTIEIGWRHDDTDAFNCARD